MDEVTVEDARVSILRRVGASLLSSVFTFVETVENAEDDVASGRSFVIAEESVETLPSGERISSYERKTV